MIRRLAVVALVCVPACTRPPSGSSSGSGSAADGEQKCSPEALGLAAAKRIVAWSIPSGCAYRGGSDALVGDEAAFQQRFQCPAGVGSGIDWSRTHLFVTSKQLPPAGTGVDVLDDGQTLTFVTKMRSPCPGERPPMPISVAIAVPVGAAEPPRQARDASCMVERHCP